MTDENLIEEAARMIAEFAAQEGPVDAFHAAKVMIGMFDKAHGEPSDAQVLAALNAYYADYMIRPNKSLDDVRPPRTVQDMRAALRSAFAVGEGGVR